MLFKAKDLVIGYDKQPVASKINFKIDKADYVCIIGENGAGKSTLVKTILGLIPSIGGEFQKEGKVSIGYLPQQTTLQKDFPATVKEIVMTGLLPQKNGLFYTKKDKEIAREKIALLGIENLEKKNFKNLSGGQQQKVLIARALCISSDILLLDEPVTGLDPNATDDLYELISRIHENGTAIIMVSHDRNAVAKEATHILYLGSDGNFFGKWRDFGKTSYHNFIKNNE